MKMILITLIVIFFPKAWSVTVDAKFGIEYCIQNEIQNHIDTQIKYYEVDVIVDKVEPTFGNYFFGTNTNTFTASGFATRIHKMVGHLVTYTGEATLNLVAIKEKKSNEIIKYKCSIKFNPSLPMKDELNVEDVFILRNEDGFVIDRKQRYLD
jgi:hypothetical protein